MNTIKKLYLALLGAILILFAACDKGFLEQSPQGQLSDAQINNKKGVEWLLTGAYGLMNGNPSGSWGNYAAAPSQWLFGDVAADNAHKGSEPGDQATMLDIERHTSISVNEHLTTMWGNYYEGVIRCNSTLKALKRLQETGSEKFSTQRATEIEAESKMLRGHYYFFLWRVFKNIPYVDENMSTEEAAKAPNTGDILPNIEGDFKFAMNSLAPTPPMGDKGRVNQLAAKSYLGKLYLYQKKYEEALPLFKDVITASPDLKTLPFLNNFNVNTENGPEAILAAQHVINPNGSGDNANVGDMLSGLYGSAPVNCCGFYQPSFDLVNSYKVDVNGLPMLDTYRNNPFTTDFLLTGAAKANYKVDQTLPFDPRLDYTVGRRGIPYHDWGIFPGDSWMRDPAASGPFVSYKTMINQADFPGNVADGAPYVTALNVNIIRLADVYLMAAECAANTNDLGYALSRVNDVRARAANIPFKKINGVNAAAYAVKPYPSFPTVDYAMKAIRFERRLELALEGHRFFDLVRWGIAKEVLESYSGFEGTYLSLYKDVSFPDKAVYFPIPQEQIDRSGGALKQNPGY